MLSKPQDQLYWRVWGQVKKRQPDADRKAMHAQPSEGWPKGLPESHRLWNNAALDEWIARCKAVSQPDNARAQIVQAAMPATRARVFIRHLLAALERDEDYAQAILTRMQRGRRHAHTGGRSLATLEQLGEGDLEKLKIALKKECRRTWPKKDDLLEVIYALAESGGFDQAAALAAVKRALNTEHLGRGVSYLVYEDLLVVLSALRALAAAMPAEVDDEAELVTSEDPY